MPRILPGITISLLIGLNPLLSLTQQLPPAVAADQSFQGLEGVKGPHDRPEKPLGPAGATLKYPLTAVVQAGNSIYVGNHTYKGKEQSR